MTLTAHLHRAWDRDGVASLRVAKRTAAELMSPDWMRERQHQIDQLPTVVWKGRRLYTITCHADSGKGPHVLNVPEALLWQLIALEAFRCPWHR